MSEIPYVSLAAIQNEDGECSSRVIHENTHNGLKPYVSVADPSNMSFGDVHLGSSSAPQTVTVRNIGYKPIDIGEIVVVGNFQIDTSAPLILQPGESFPVVVTYVPKVIGIETGGISLKLGLSGLQFVHLDGSGIAA